MVITNIEKNKGKIYSVYVDDKISFEISEYVLIKLDINIGMELTEKELDLIKNQVLISMAKNDAINFISYKIRTAHEVEIKLREKYPNGVIEETVSFLNENGYLNDELYAERFINEKKKLGKLSKKELAYKLMEKGLKKDLINKVIDKMEYVETEYAQRIVSKINKVRNKKEEAHIKSYLYRKGFSKDTIDEIMNTKKD
ncbi:MAG: RecX family transcriptional regulator [Deltaproteobacteria bacterium]